MLTRDDWFDHLVDSIPAWSMSVIHNIPRDIQQVSTIEELPVDELITAAMAEAQRYAETPGHGEDLSDSEIQHCLAMGVRAIQRRYYQQLSPVDRPGLLGPMPLGELLASVWGVLQAQRGFAGMAPEPAPPRPQSQPATGPYPWSWAGR